MKDVHTRRDAHLASMHQVTKSEALFLNTFSSLGYFFLACPSTHYFLRAYFSLLKLWPFPKWRASRLPASCTASPTPTSPAESRLEFQMFFFRLLLTQMPHQFLHEFLNTRFLSNIQSIRKELIMWEKGLMLKEPKENSITAFCSYVIEAI